MHEASLIVANYTNSQMGSALAIIIAIMGAVLLAINLWKALAGKKPVNKIDPLPLPVNITRDFATKEEVKDVEQGLCRRVEQVVEMIESDRKANRESIGKVHSRIDKLVENTAEIKGEMKQFNQNVELLLKDKLKG